MFCHEFQVQRLDAARADSRVVRGELKERRTGLTAILDGIFAARREQASDRAIIAARHHARQRCKTLGAAATWYIYSSNVQRNAVTQAQRGTIARQLEEVIAHYEPRLRDVRVNAIAVAPA